MNRNLTIRDASNDAIVIQDGAHHIWVDHCSFTNCFDGTVDITHGCDYITVSWNRFYSHDKTMLLGHEDTNGAEDAGHLRVTYHHNWFDGTNQRHPRVRFSALAHVFNNYYDGVTSYGVGSSMFANVLVENNFFANVPTPFLSTSGVGESLPGYLKARDNAFVNCGATREQNQPQLVPEASDFYDYTPDPAADIPEIVTGCAGVGKLSSDPPIDDNAVQPQGWTAYH
jgi:pectate lyase